MNALRVVALRLQNMKGQLEQLNEPVDDLMEVSKVQTQILNLTGNQVDIFDSTTQEFRSTYDILKDISEVWDNLSSVNRAKLTEILFGKNRANTGLAIIQAFQSGQIESAYKSALNAEGTAVEENERLMQGIKASLDALKGAFQELSNAIMSSGFLKSIIDGASSFLKVLTAIVDKVGALPPLLTAIGAFAGFKGVNMGAGLMSIFGMGAGGGSSSAALTAINNYNAAMQQTNTVAGYNAIIQGTVNRELEAGNVVFANYIKGLNGAKASMAGYTTQLIAAKAQTAALQVGTIALNAAISLGIGLAVSYVATQISKLAKAEEEAQKKANELRQEANKTADSYKEERESLLSLTSDYIKLATTTSDLSSQKEKLLEIQGKINDGFNSEKESVDLLNDSLSKNISLLNKQSYEDAQDAIQELGAEYQEALKFMDTDSLVFKDKGLYYKSAFDRVAAILGSDNIEQYTNKLGQVQGFTINSGEGLEKNLELVDKLLSQYDDYLAGANDEKLYQMYKSEYDIIKKISDEYHKQYQESQNVIKNFETAQKVSDDYTEQLSADKSSRIYEILETAKELSLTLNDTSSGAEKYAAIQQLNELENKARELAGTNEILQSDIALVFKSIDSGAKSTINSIDDIRSEWFESLGEMEKSTFKNIDTMKSALQNVSGGGLLSSSDFWDLAELDVDHILDGAQLVGDQYRVTEEQLIKLKDTYIQKQIEQLRIQNQTLQDQIDGTNGVNDGLKKQLEYETLILEAQIAKGVNSAGDARLVSESRARINAIKEQMKGYGEEISRNDMLIKQLNGSLGNTVDRQKQLTDLTKNLQSQADNLLKAQEYRIDQIIDKYENEKEAIEDAKKVLEDQLAVLEEQEDALKNTIENYKTVAETVQSAIQEQIDKIKEENEERENALDLATKLANLENARNKKVRIYTEAGGWQYEAKKSDVEKAERELEKTKEDERIKLLEAQLKKWQNITDKRQKAENERLAEEILGADWRLKISEQDEEIFNKYEKEYDAYGDQLWTISNVEIATLKKSIEAKDKDIAAKEAQIKEWQKYKSAVQKAADDAKAANEEYMKYLNTVQVDENSSLEARERNLQNFATQYAGIMDQISQYSQQIGSLGGSINIDTTNIEKAATEMGDFIEKYRDGVLAMSEALDASSTGYGIVNSEWDAKLVRAAKELKALRGYANGGVADRTGLAMLHGTKQRSETIFNANDSAKLYDLVHSTPNLVTSNDSRSVTLNGTVINLPNVQNAEQFARQFESYMQTVLAESQVYKPSR